MGTALSIIAIAVLVVLLVVSLRRQLGERAAKKKAVARAYTGEADAQLARSQEHRAGVRAAHAERAREKASEAEAGKVGSDADE